MADDMRTFLSASVLLVAVASTACISTTADPHPACAGIDVGSKVEVAASVDVRVDTAIVDLGAPLTLTHCTAVIAPGVKASGFDAKATIQCRDDASTVFLETTVAFADFRSAAPGSKVDARAAAELELRSPGSSYSGTSGDRATIDVASRSGAVTGDDVSSSYQLRGVLRLQITKVASLYSAGASHLTTVQPSTIEVPFTWTQGAFQADYSACPQ